MKRMILIVFALVIAICFEFRYMTFAEVDCGDNSAYYAEDDECICDDGYEPSEDGNGCIDSDRSPNDTECWRFTLGETDGNHCSFIEDGKDDLLVVYASHKDGDIRIYTTDNKGVIIDHNRIPVTYVSSAKINKEGDFLILGNGPKTLLLYDSDFNVIWKTLIGFDNDSYDYYSNEVFETTDGYLVSGGKGNYYSRSCVLWYALIGHDGAVKWKKEINDETGMKFCGISPGPIIEANDKGYVMLATQYITSDIENSLWLIKIDEKGDVEWDEKYFEDGLEESFYYENQLINKVEDGYLITSFSQAKKGEKWVRGGIWVLKIDNDGLVDWQVLHTNNGITYLPRKAKLKDDGGFIVIGDVKILEDHKKYDIYVAKYDKEGSKEWDGKITGDGEWDLGCDIINTDNDGYVFVGVSNEKIIVGNTGTNGECLEHAR